VKSEPLVLETEQNKSSSNPPMSYFTNPIPFKQEPNELGQSTQQQQSSSNEQKPSEESNAISIVTHLLKDKQILNQLEKVARSFQTPKSGYQGTWNFKS
jgi:hypothetical protein